MLDQRFRLQNSFTTKSYESPELRDKHAFAIKCIVVVGMMPTDTEQQKSLELYRASNSAVEIVTFDELLNKLEVLQDLISKAPCESSDSVVEVSETDADSIPF